MNTLKDFLKECGSVAEVSRRLNVPRQTIDRWLTGKFKPSRAMVELIRLKEVDLAALKEPKPV